MHSYSGEELEFLKENKPGLTYKQLCLLLNTKFNLDVTEESIGKNCRSLGINPLRTHQWTDENYQFLRDNISKSSYRELCKKINKRFGWNTNAKAVQHACKRFGLNHGHPGATFTKGEKNSFSPTLPIGSEMESAGKIYVKVADTVMSSGQSNVGTGKNWVQKNRYVYETNFGEIPDGYQIVALDGNRRNYDPQNLYAVPKQINMMLCANKWFSQNRDITLAAIKYCELFYAIKDFEREKCK